MEGRSRSEALPEGSRGARETADLQQQRVDQNCKAVEQARQENEKLKSQRIQENIEKQQLAEQRANVKQGSEDIDKKAKSIFGQKTGERIIGRYTGQFGAGTDLDLGKGRTAFAKRSYPHFRNTTTNRK